MKKMIANRYLIKELGKTEAVKTEEANLCVENHIYSYNGGEFFGDSWHITLLRYMASGDYKPEAYDRYIELKYKVSRTTISKQRSIFRKLHLKIKNEFPKWTSKTERSKELEKSRNLQRRISRSPIAKNLLLDRDSAYAEKDDFQFEDETLNEYIDRDMRAPGESQWKLGSKGGPKPVSLKAYVKANIRVKK